MREQKTPDDLVYRYGYQGEYSEKDLETGWNHFELREFDPIIARWLVPDPARQYYSPYVAMGNDPINMVDIDGGFSDCPECDAAAAQWGALAEQYAVRASIWNKISDFFSNVDWVLSVEGQIDAGLAAKFSEKVSSFSVDAEVNVVSMNLFKGQVDLTESPEAWGYEFMGGDEGVYVTNSIGIGAYKSKEAGGNTKVGVGAYAEQHQRVHSGFVSRDYDKSAGIDLLTKSYSTKKIDGFHKNPQVGGKVGKSKGFYGLELGGSAMFLLGGDLKIKVGFNR